MPQRQPKHGPYSLPHTTYNLSTLYRPRQRLLLAIIRVTHRDYDPTLLFYYYSATSPVGDELLPDALHDVQAVLVDDVAFVIAQLPLVIELLGGHDRRVLLVHLLAVRVLKVGHDWPQAMEVVVSLLLQAVRLRHGDLARLHARPP